VAGERALAEENSLGRLQTICDDGSRAVSTYNRTLERWDTATTESPRKTCTGQMNPRTRQVEVRSRSLMPSYMTGDPERGDVMESEEILDALEEYLGQYVGGTRRLAWQDPYRGDLFKLFLQAYKQGHAQSAGPAPLTGSAIRDEIIARSQPTPPSPDQREFLEQIVILWDAWSYALDRYQEGV
jgi:hypothetical protein